MERELIATGIGGQGVQLAAQVTARAAVHQGLQVQMFGSYGGMMRGGNTDAAVVLADGPVMAPPVVPSCWIGMAMHHAYLPPMLDKLRADSLLFVNTSVVEERPEVGAGVTVVDVPATDLAIDVGSAMAASVVMLGAIVGATGLLTRESVLAAIDESLPPYRQQHRDLNGRALDAGMAATPTGLAVAWPALQEAR
jgi:2-oxoglutarate ferredoxin oxidoreductase subunit gamma